MPRDFKIFLKDILQAIERIEEYAGDLSYEDFCENHLVQDVALNDVDKIPVSSCDINVDGWVSLTDFSTFAIDFGLNRQRSDFDFSGSVTLSDFSTFAIEFGSRQTC